MSSQEDIIRAIQSLYSRLGTLRSINEADILIPGGSQEQYHQTIEEAYAVLGSIETEVDALKEELEYQHKRLDDARDAALAILTQHIRYT